MLINPGAFSQDTITDYDGNVYHTVTIGTQVWLKENLNSVHYSDGVPVPGVVAYNNSDSMAAIYGLLYPWNDAMRNSTTPGSQGVCPDGWHIPTHAEWTVMDNFLGGWTVAGGKLKEAGYDHWLPPNTGATNSSGFTALPAGEYDANQNMCFQFLGTAAVFWTSNQTSTVMARERYLSHDDAKSNQCPWYKTMKYSIRCLRDLNTDTHSGIIREKKTIRISNPFSNELTISCSNSALTGVVIYSVTGMKVIERDLGETGRAVIETSSLPAGIYLLEVFSTTDVSPGIPSVNTGARTVFTCVKVN